jgi:hypothetical protein
MFEKSSSFFVGINVPKAYQAYHRMCAGAI